MTIFGMRKRALTGFVGALGLAGIGLATAAVPAGAQSGAPVGHVDSVELTGNQVKVVGWATNRASPNESPKVDLYVDDEYAATSSARLARPDVAAAFPAYGPTTGFAASTTLSPGVHQVCAMAISDSSLNVRLGCRQVSITSQPAEQPVGYFDSLSVNGQQVTASGWAVQPAASSDATIVDFYVDGDYAASSTTGGQRPDVAAAFPTFGPATGFQVGFSVPSGSHSVCAFATSETTLNTRLGCKSVKVDAVSGELPVGYLDIAERAGSGVRVSGWAADPSSPARNVSVDLYVDGDYTSTLTADRARPDVEAAFASYGPSTGFAGSVGLSSGSHRVCVFAIGENTLNTRLGCKSVNVEGAPDVQPSGVVDTFIVGADQVRVVGWAADSASPERNVKVDVYVDGAYSATGTSDGTRTDVQAAYPKYGPTTGFDITADVASGQHRVCVYAIDDVALNTLLGCTTVST